MLPKTKTGFTKAAAAALKVATEDNVVSTIIARQPINETAAKAAPPAVPRTDVPASPVRDSAPVLPPIPEVDDQKPGGKRDGLSLPDEALPTATLLLVNTEEKPEEKPEAGNAGLDGQEPTTPLESSDDEALQTPSAGLMAPTSTTKSTAAEVFFTRNETEFEELLSIKTLDDIKPQDYDRASGKLMVDGQGGKAAPKTTQNLLKKILKNARDSEHDDIAQRVEQQDQDELQQWQEETIAGDNESDPEVFGTDVQTQMQEFLDLDWVHMKYAHKDWFMGYDMFMIDNLGDRAKIKNFLDHRGAQGKATLESGRLRVEEIIKTEKAKFNELLHMPNPTIQHPEQNLLPSNQYA